MATYTIDKIKYGNDTFKLQDTVSGYTQNTGTVTSVGISNATNGGLSVSGSPITGSGSITVGHSNILTNAQTTQALYPITIDKNGHISGYGSAITVAPYINGQNSTPILSWTHTTVSGIDGVYLGYQDGDDTSYLFLPSGAGFNTGVQNILTQVSQNYVPKTRTINGKALSADVTLAASDLAMSSTSLTTISSVGTLPSLTFTPNASTNTLAIDWSAGTLPTTNTQAGVLLNTDTNVIPNVNGVSY